MPKKPLPNKSPNPEPSRDGLLSFRQQAFVDALFGPARGKATKAARLAGYGGTAAALHVTASRLLSSAKVLREIALRVAERNRSPEWTQLRLIEVASSSMANFLLADDKGELRIDGQRATEAAALGQLKVYREKVRDLEGGRREITRTVELHDPVPALAILARAQGIVKDAPPANAVAVQANVNLRFAGTMTPEIASLAQALMDRLNDIENQDKTEE